jgi:cell division septal protein FtsQ
MPAPSRGNSARKPRPWLRFILLLLCVAALATTSLMAFQQVESFLIGDARFALAPPPEYSNESGNLRITGVRNASRRSVIQIFSRDFGRSIYLTPLAERRRNLLAVDWVRDAAVCRVWPDRIDVHVEERTPVAFVALADSAGAARTTLIDEEGVLLEPQGPIRVRMPVLVGIRRDQTESSRRDRVRRMQRLLEEAGPYGAKISDIDVSNPENLSVTMKAADRAVVLILGNRDFRERFDRFTQHYSEIRKHAPQAAVFDVRLENRITLPAETGAARPLAKKK